MTTGLLISSFERKKCVVRSYFSNVGPRKFNREQQSLRNHLRKSVKGTSLALESIDNIQSSYSLATSVFSVSDCVAYNVLQETLENGACFIINCSRNALNTSTTCKSANCRLSNALNVISQDLLMSLSTSFTQTFCCEKRIVCALYLCLLCLCQSFFCVVLVVVFLCNCKQVRDAFKAPNGL